jgi:phosphatidylserine/phosphatidylglycerophosphate/cardiolipin synthase-like enzyme
MSAAAKRDFESHIPPVAKGSYPVRHGNLVRPLIDGEAAFTRICEAVEAAQHSVWVTVAFIHPTFEMPGGRGSFFDVLDRAKTRNLDVRVIFWRTHRAEGQHFHGHDHERAWLAKRGSQFLARWDRAQKHYCQHQKSWLIDAGKPGETVFVGGINLNPNSVTSAGHADRDGAHTHDVYCELRGPSASDVHHNFVQRWNEASEAGQDHGVWPQGTQTHLLPFPAEASPAVGHMTVQMQRSVRAGHYTDATPTPDGEAFDIANGERSIFDQYVAAIDAARETIYIEDQYIASPDIVAHLKKALERGVEVVFLAPASPEDQVRAARKRPEAQSFWETLAALGRHPHFTLAGIASPRTGEDIYIHDKIMLVDDHWATIGSCNIASQSFFCDTELNAAIWDAEFVRALRVALLKEHLGVDTAGLGDRDALAHFRDIARANADARRASKAMQGLAFALDPATYAM